MITPSILGQLQTLAVEHPDKLLYSFLDVDGDPIESYTYASFLLRAEAIAEHLLRDSRFEAGDRLLLAYPPGLEMICAFFGCVRAGLIPVPVYPPTSRGFQSALYKMVHIAKDCQATGILTSHEYHASLKTNLARNGVSTSWVDVDYISGLPWIATESFLDTTGHVPQVPPSKILFLQYTSGSTMEPKGVIVSHENILSTAALVVENESPVVVSWLPQYHDMGLIGCYLYPALRGGTTYGFSPMDFIQRPVLWFETISKYRATSTAAPNFAYDYCLRAGRLPRETMESCDLSSLLVLMCAAEPVKPDTFTRFLEAFEPYGLQAKSFYVAYGLAENTLAVTLHGRNIVSVNKRALTLGQARMTTEVSEIDNAKQIVSCGVPLAGLDLKIVDPEAHSALEPGRIGEIWLAGSGKCQGYWNNAELTLKQFRARLTDDSPYDEGYLRTGDLGFMHEGELYVCGRIKDLIILRGQNYYPHDIENIVEKSSSLIRHNCVAAFQIHEDNEPALAIVAEVKNPKVLPDARKIAAAVRSYLNVEVAAILLIAPRAVPRTSSGKIMRHKTKQMWMAGEFNVLSDFSRDGEVDAAQTTTDINSPFTELKARYNLTGRESYNLIEAGLDSLDLVLFMHELKELLKDKGAELLARQVDIGLVQRVSVAELFSLADQLDSAPEEAILHLREFLSVFRQEQNALEMQMMREDTKLLFDPPAPAAVPKMPRPRQVLLTGGTGFIGPFLMKSLLEQTIAMVHVLVRAADEEQGKQRLRAAMNSMGDVSAELMEMFEARITAVCGDLGQPGLGLMQETWDALTAKIDTIFHNGATVNYLFNYDMMRDANVLGTNEILRFAFEGPAKEFNYVSTTFIHGWAHKPTLFETDCNADMALLDFGYSQTKWVAEQVVFAAQAKGLSVRVFRPALVSPSVDGGGNNFDIAIRLVAFMVNHGIGVDTLNQVSFVPADIVANNIVAISNSPGTANQTYHVVRDDYSNMTDITRLITESTGRQFDAFLLPDFVPELIRRCSKEDLLFPLLDFLVGSVDNISSMEFKRYESTTYQAARNASAWGRPDPSLEDTVNGILKFMNRKGIISVAVRERGRESTSEVLVDSGALSVTAS